jgi:hypothetical protein
MPTLLSADIDFETFPGGAPIFDDTPITTQFPGITFTNTTVISAGISLNEFELPPHSGSNAAFDDGGPISIAFNTPVSSFSGYFTYYEPVTIAAFNGSGMEVASANSAFSINVACGDGAPCLGDASSSPNEFIQIASSGGFSNVTITGDPNGSSLVMDDIDFAPASSTAAEPSNLFVLLASLLSIMVFKRIYRRYE